jgi:hypothetical protein
MPSGDGQPMSALGQNRTYGVQNSTSAYPRKRTLAGSLRLQRLTGGPLIVVTGINVTAAFALEEVHIASLFAPFNSLSKLQFAATTRTRARIGTGGLHRTDVAHGGQMAL